MLLRFFYNKTNVMRLMTHFGHQPLIWVVGETFFFKL